MKEAPILLSDFNHSHELVEALETELKAVPDLRLPIHHERLAGTDPANALEQLSAAMVSVAPDLLIVLFSKEAQASAPEIFQYLLGQQRCPPILVVPASAEPGAINELYQLGASEYLLPPFRSVDVQPRVRRLLACRHRQRTPIAALKRALGLKQLVGESPALMEQIQKIPKVARCDACVLITGETGTGKEVCARAIHFLSARANEPFVPLNCGAVPVDLLENELFGHAAGAFTSASASQVGVIEEANGGTLFLDEIDSLTPAAQVKLLRFLQNKEYRPLGSRKVLRADLRIIAASNANVDALLKQGKMRPDLFYRINVFPLRLPALRERKEDIPLLVRHFLARHGHECSPAVQDIDSAAMRKLLHYEWPGNVRELENVVERSILLSTSGIIQHQDIDLPEVIATDLKPESFNRLKATIVADFERSYLRTMLEQHRGNIAQAARAAQKNRRVFFQLMRKHHLRVERVERAGDASDPGPVANVVITVDKNVRPAARP